MTHWKENMTREKNTWSISREEKRLENTLTRRKEKKRYICISYVSSMHDIVEERKERKGKNHVYESHYNTHRNISLLSIYRCINTIKYCIPEPFIMRARRIFHQNHVDIRRNCYERPLTIVLEFLVSYVLMQSFLLHYYS
jgi:hypothetical protein